MKVKCITNKVSSLPREILNNYKISYEEFFIKEDKEYVVYAVMIYLGYIWYCICDERYTNCPMWHPSTLFELTNDRLSRYWIFSFNEENHKKLPYLSFPEWSNDPYFYGELVDGGKKEISLFNKYKNLMDLEFPNSSISMIAQIIEEDWLFCPLCIDAWQYSDDKDALVKCPKCQQILNNPRYTNKWPYL